MEAHVDYNNYTHDVYLGRGKKRLEMMSSLWRVIEYRIGWVLNILDHSELALQCRLNTVAQLDPVMEA